jgi:hypothetical protein
MEYRHCAIVLGALARAGNGQFMGNNTINVIPPFPDGIIPCMQFPSKCSTIPLNITKGLGRFLVLSEILLM